MPHRKPNTTRCYGALLAAASFSVFSFTGAHAVVLGPGDIELLSGTTAAARPELAGTVLVDTLRPFSIDLGGGLSITGQVQDRVVRSDVDGTLDFYYRIINDAASGGSILLAVRSDFSAVTTDADWRTDGLGVDGPNFSFRAPDGADVFFSFFDEANVDPGEDSRFFFVKTNATEFNANGSAFLTGAGPDGSGTSATFLTYQPTIVPLPAAVWLLGSGMLGLIGIARRNVTPCKRSSQINAA